MDCRLRALLASRPSPETLAGLRLPAGTATELVESLYDGGSDGIIELVQALPDRARCALVVGHAPSVPGVLHELVDESSAEPSAWSVVATRFPPATLAALTSEGWSDLSGARLASAVCH